MRKTSIHGYSDVPSAAPGERVGFFVSADEPGRYRADVVRLGCGDTNPQGPGFKETLVDTAVSGEYPARSQAIHAGSHVLVEDGGGLHPSGAFTLHVYVHATTPAKGAQGILTRSYELFKRTLDLTKPRDNASSNSRIELSWNA